MMLQVLLFKMASWLSFNKILVFVACIGWTIFPTYAQQGENLVPNGSFEEMSTCQFGLNFGVCDEWEIQYGTPNYFNRCTSGNFDVPFNFPGFQEIESGDAYMGVATYTSAFAGGQESVRIPFTEPLQSGVKYRVRFKASMADSSMYSSCCIGLIISSVTPPHPPFSENLSTLELVIPVNGYNTADWFQFDTTFTATGGENKIFMGSFRPDAASYPVLINPSSTNIAAYFYIDDVEVYVDDTVTNIDEGKQFDLNIEYNPIGQSIVVKGATGNVSVRLFDTMGRLVGHGNGNLDVSGLAGMFIVRVMDRAGNILGVKKVVIY